MDFNCDKNRKYKLKGPVAGDSLSSDFVTVSDRLLLEALKPPNHVSGITRERFRNRPILKVSEAELASPIFGATYYQHTPQRVWAGLSSPFSSL